MYQTTQRDSPRNSNQNTEVRLRCHCISDNLFGYKISTCLYQWRREIEDYECSGQSEQGEEVCNLYSSNVSSVSRSMHFLLFQSQSQLELINLAVQETSPTPELSVLSSRCRQALPTEERRVKEDGNETDPLSEELHVSS